MQHRDTPKIERGGDKIGNSMQQTIIDVIWFHAWMKYTTIAHTCIGYYKANSGLLFDRIVTRGKNNF